MTVSPCNFELVHHVETPWEQTCQKMPDFFVIARVVGSDGALPKVLLNSFTPKMYFLTIQKPPLLVERKTCRSL